MLHGKQDLDKDPVAQQSTVLEQVPIIDITELRVDSAAPQARPAVDSIAEACGSWGFFQVTNHGISQDLIDQVWEQTRGFFALPIERKLAVLRSRENPWGFYHNELTKNQRDKKQVFDFTREGTDPIYGQSNRWPAQQEDFKSTMQEYFTACTQLSLQLLEAFCIGLDLPAKFMHADFASNHTGFLRLNYYPVHDPIEGAADDYQAVADLGVHHHTDAGALTVLIQDEVGGLQVHRDGYWYDIPPVPGAIVINTGDMMQVWSNDVYHAPVHRVLAMDTCDRYSLPFFFNPAAHARVSPLPTVANEQNPSLYRPIEWGSFRGKRSDGDYADYGTEVQISQFRR
ncbi:hypothetical protein N9164_07565 [Draconibacterium sp.]|nr:hypothetical protein [Draconibacterium sp.]